MAVKALNFKMEESDILDLKSVAEVYNMSMTEIIREAIKEYVEELKKDPFYRLTVNGQDASADETEEILAEIDSLNDDDLSIASAEHIAI